MGFTLTETTREPLKLMTLEYTNKSHGTVIDEPVVELFCRDKKGRRRQINVTDYYPHFLVTEEEFVGKKDSLLTDGRVRHIEADERVLSYDEKLNGAIHPVSEPPKKTLDGEDLVKIYTVVPGDVAELREEFDRHFEADVFFTNRFLIDSGITMGLSVPKGASEVSFDEITAIEGDAVPDVRPRMLTVDIEVWSGGSFPDTTDPKKPVTAITAHDSFTDEYFSGVLHPKAVQQGDNHSWQEFNVEVDLDAEERKALTSEDIDELKRNRDWKMPDGVSSGQCEVEVYYQEQALLGGFNQFVIDTDPDLMTGWNSSRNEIGSGFDYPYLLNRCDRLNEWSYTELPYDNGGVFVTDRGSAQIGGREMFDMLQAYKKTQIHEKRSYGLGAIAQDELGYGKEDVEDLDEGWLHNPVDFMKYNIRDTEAVHKIEEEKSVLEIYDHIRSIAGATYSEIADSNIGIIDMLFLRRANENGYALPTSTRPDTQHYWGAYVFDPEPGKHENVVYPDLSSLYPNLFRDMNASPETIIGDEAALRESQYTADDCHTIYVDPRDESVKKDADEPKRTQLYVLKPEIEESFVREIVQELIDMKYEYKKDKYADEAYSAVKRITNSCFTPDTEVMTPKGIKKITEIEVGDDVYSWNKETGNMQIKSVTETIEKPDYDGEIVHIENNNIDLKVTPDHRMIVKRPRHSNEWETKDAGNLNKWTHYETPNRWEMDHGSHIDEVDLAKFVDNSFTVKDDYITAGNRHSKFDRYVDGDAFIELVGWFITEGSSYISNNNEDRGDSLHISQYKSINEDVYCEIENTFEELELTHISGERSVEVCGSVYPNILDNICGSGSENKKIPSFIFEDSSLEQKKRLLEVLMMGDGDKRKTPKRYSTKSKQLRDDVMKLLWEIGHKPKYRYDDGGEYNTGVWRINYTTDDNGDESKQSFRMHRDGSMETAENGVYCVQVEDNHTLVAGRNGKFTNIFNCYGVMGDSVSYGKGFRLFDWRIAEAITLAGRDVIKHTADTFESRVQSMGYANAEIIAGDTDSCVCTIPGADGNYNNSYLTRAQARNRIDGSDVLDAGKAPVDSAIHETLLAAIDAAEYVDMTYDEFMADRFNIEDGNMSVEIESYSEAALFMDKKKRYAQRIRWDEGDYEDEIEVKGFELVRSDSARITGDVQQGVIDRILEEDSPESVVSDYLQDEWHTVLDARDDLDLERLGTPSAINNKLFDYGWSIDDDTDEVKYFTPQPHIRGARYAKAYIEGEDPSEGSKPLMFYTSGVTPNNGLPETYDYDEEYSLNAPEDKDDANRREMKEIDREVDAVAVEDVRNLPEAVNVDYDKMATKTIRDPVEPLVEVMGWSFTELVEEGEQSGLASFM